MSNSAKNRASRKAQTAYRITVCAQRLAAEHGLDGFTMEDLAEAAEVSRRTLFNYYDGKEDAVLGGHHDFPEGPRETFRTGGPEGRLLRDAVFLVGELLGAQEVTPEQAQVSKRALERNPGLMYASVQRFEQITDQFRADIAIRTGWAEHDSRTTLMIRLLAALVQEALERYAATSGASLADVFAETARDAIALTTH